MSGTFILLLVHSNKMLAELTSEFKQTVRPQTALFKSWVELPSDNGER